MIRDIEELRAIAIEMGKPLDKLLYEMLTDAMNENQELDKQLEDTNEEVCILDMITDENIKYKNQQKEFIEFLEKMWKETQDIWYIKILQKYKEIIGDKE